MTRKIRRNFARWFLKPFWKSKKKVEWQPPTTIPKLDRRKMYQQKGAGKW